MVNADIKLDGEKTIVEGNWLIVKCWDIKLDSTDRRKSATGERRALVHGFNDNLVINYASDYPGGVTILGELKIPDKIKQDHFRLESHDLHLNHPDRRSTPNGTRRALVHGFNDELVLNYNGDYPGGVAVHSNFAVIKGKSFFLKNSNNDIIVRIDSSGNLTLGGSGQDGDIMLKDNEGHELIRIDTQNNKIEFKDTTGLVKVRIKSDHFTESNWPVWPGEAIQQHLDLIKEMRRMKEEILAMQAEIEILKSGG